MWPKKGKGNIQEKLSDFRFDDEFLDMTPKEQGTKEKIDLIKIKTCAKDTMKRVKKNIHRLGEYICKSWMIRV